MGARATAAPNDMALFLFFLRFFLGRGAQLSLFFIGYTPGEARMGFGQLLQFLHLIHVFVVYNMCGRSWDLRMTDKPVSRKYGFSKTAYVGLHLRILTRISIKIRTSFLFHI